MALSVFLKNVCFSRKACYKLKKKHEIPKLVHDYPKTGAWRYKKWCLTIVRIVSEIPNWMPNDWLYRWVQISWWPLENRIWAVQYSFNMQLAGIRPTKALSRPPLVVRHHIWDLRSDPRNGAGRLSGTTFGTVRHQFWDHQASVLGSSGTSFGISRLFFIV